MAEFLRMGGYGGFVWTAFAATLLVLIVLLLVSHRSLKANEDRLAELTASSPPSPREDE